MIHVTGPGGLALRWVVLLSLTEVHGIFLSMEPQNIVIPTTLLSGSLITRLYVHQEPTYIHLEPDPGAVNCYILQCLLDGGPLLEESCLFLLNSTDNTVYLKQSQSASLSSSKDLTNYTLSIECSSQYQSLQTVLNITLSTDTRWQHTGCNTFSQDGRQDISSLCFSGEEIIEFAMFERMTDIELGQLGPVHYKDVCPDDRIPQRDYMLTSADDSLAAKLVVDAGMLKLVESLDREASDTAVLTVTCSVTRAEGEEVMSSASRDVTIRILDINDNGPYINQRNRTTGDILLVQSTHRELEPNQSVRFVFSDKDSEAVNHYTASIQDDPDNILQLMPIVKSYTDKYTFGINVTRKPESDLSASVVIHDTAMVTKEEALSKAVFHIQVKASVPTTTLPHAATATLLFSAAQMNASVEDRRPRPGDLIHATITTAAAKYSTVVVLGSMWHNYRIVHTSADLPFAVSTYRGMVYTVEDLTAYADTVIYFPVTADVGFGRSVDMFVNISVVQSDGPFIKYCDQSCAVARSEETCRSMCGYGARTGRCVWRNASTELHYSTCVPTVDDCPDSECGEDLESQLGLCPQDCATEVPGKPPGLLNRGIPKETHGICFCETYDMCQCIADDRETPGTHTTMKTSVGDIPYGLASPTPMMPHGYYGPPYSASADLTTWSANHSEPPVRDIPYGLASPTPMMPHGYYGPPYSASADLTTWSANHSEPPVNVTHCGMNCKIIVSMSLLGGCVLFSLIIILWRYRLRGKKPRGMKHVNSMVSLSVIPSDYIDDHPSSGLLHVDWNPQLVDAKFKPDPQWEFPRANLQLDKTLGEGEFGRVISAKALNLQGHKGTQTVAVKMLKECATTAEMRDLLSEYNLLKDVSHKNVIKLLGVCSQKGPFYLIVEYCELGSLRSYLRKNRQFPPNYITHDEQTRCDDITNRSDDITNRSGDITEKDLLSFAWQTALGMQYLCEMKLVHRDLAARNLLVATGKVIKISDFGLTRDIYEGDAYLKRSKGRIPVKWMAPESLYDQIYTSKSDVWSFGVVLWEIVTFGANPYAGVPPERLYQLLKTGYRMEKPHGCSVELFQMMERCWREDPNERHSFKYIVSQFETMLRANVAYLDLTDICEHQTPLDEETLDSTGDTVDSMKSPDRQLDADHGSINVLSTDDNSYVLTPTLQPNGEVTFGSWPRGQTNNNMSHDMSPSSWSCDNTRPEEGATEETHFLQEVATIDQEVDEEELGDSSVVEEEGLVPENRL